MRCVLYVYLPFALFLCTSILLDAAPVETHAFAKDALQSLAKKGWKTTTGSSADGSSLLLQNKDNIVLSVFAASSDNPGLLKFTPDVLSEEADNRTIGGWTIILFSTAPKGRFRKERGVAVIAVDSVKNPTKRIEVSFETHKKGTEATLLSSLVKAKEDIARIFRSFGWRGGDAYRVESGMIKVGSGFGIVIDPKAM